MVFKKVMQSDAPIVIGNSDNKEQQFPPGFCYRIGGLIYTVKADVTQERNSPMRELSLSDGSTEIIPVESIIRDLREPDCDILEPDKRFVKTEVAPKVVKKKTSKKKVKKKKATKKKVAKKKRAKNNDN